MLNKLVGGNKAVAVTVAPGDNTEEGDTLLTHNIQDSTTTIMKMKKKNPSVIKTEEEVIHQDQEEEKVVEVKEKKKERKSSKKQKRVTERKKEWNPRKIPTAIPLNGTEKKRRCIKNTVLRKLRRSALHQLDEQCHSMTLGAGRFPRMKTRHERAQNEVLQALLEDWLLIMMRRAELVAQHCRGGKARRSDGEQALTKVIERDMQYGLEAQGRTYGSIE